MSPLLYYQPAYLNGRAKVVTSGTFSIAFTLNKKVAVSLPIAPFGGFWGASNEWAAFAEFEQHFCAELRIAGATSLLVVQPPACYPAAPAQWLESAGYERQFADLHHYVPLHGSPLKALHLMQHRKLRQSETPKIQQELLTNIGCLYDFIAECRQAQGIPLNIDVVELERQVQAFPDRYMAFSALYHEKLAAVVIMSVPIPGVAYYFLPATASEFRTRSPMVHLLAHLYAHLVENGFYLLDMGISSIQGTPQASLATFKERMGAQVAQRVTYGKML